jgi:hypothetical protein
MRSQSTNLPRQGHDADGKAQSGRRVTSGEPIVARVATRMPRLGAYWKSRVDLESCPGEVCSRIQGTMVCVRYGEGPSSGGCEEFKECEWPLSAVGDRILDDSSEDAVETQTLGWE